MNRRTPFALLLLACVAASLLTGIAGGLLRTGVAAFDPAHTWWLPQAALSHAALMICAFFGTVIGIERAVAARRLLAWMAPFASAAATPALLTGRPLPAATLLCAAAVVFVAVNIALWQRQRAPHTALLVASALAWLVGNLLFAARVEAAAVLPWWFAFLVVTIAAERLEMTRLMRRRRGADASLYTTLVALFAGAAATAWSPTAGGVIYGASLVALSCWLLSFDIARRTVRADGLARYMAVSLLGGYAWLAVGGLAWIATALGAPARDTALHALGLGFIFSMVMGHAPVILPAVARVKLKFGAVFYLPLALLHATLAWRLAAGWADGAARATGAIGNAIAIGVFAAVVLGSVMAGRRTLAPVRPASGGAGTDDEGGARTRQLQG